MQYNVTKETVVDTIKTLDEEHLNFICEVWNKDKDFVLSRTNDDDYDELYDILCDIEVEETEKADDNDTDLSKRGKLAENLVTIIGNVYRDEYKGHDEDWDDWGDDNSD